MIHLPPARLEVVAYTQSQGFHVLELRIDNPHPLHRWFGPASELPVKAPVRLRFVSSERAVLEIVRTNIEELAESLRTLESSGVLVDPKVWDAMRAAGSSG